MDPYMGEIRIFAGNFAPVNWHFCDGSLLPLAQNQALYSLLGTVWGGNGVTTFALPDLRGRLPVGQGQGAGLTNRILAQTGGVSAVQLTENNMPAHNHAVKASNSPATDVNLSAGSGLAQCAVPPTGKVARYAPPGANPAPVKVTLDPDTIAADGGLNQPHSNLMPYLGVNYIISLVGLYPTRSS